MSWMRIGYIDISFLIHKHMGLTIDLLAGLAGWGWRWRWRWGWGWGEQSFVVVSTLLRVNLTNMFEEFVRRHELKSLPILI